MIPSGLISISSGAIFCCKIAACSAVKGVDESPWNERVQSTCLSSSLRAERGSSSPSVSDRKGFVSDDGERVEATFAAFAAD